MARTLMARFELVLESIGKNPLASDLGSFSVIFFFYIENGILCILVGIASMTRF